MLAIKVAIIKSHERPQADKWMEAFYGRNLAFDQAPSLVNLINEVTKKFLAGCTSVILYDSSVEQSEGLVLEQLFRNYPLPYVHGQITSDYKIQEMQILRSTGKTCVNYIMFMADVMRSMDVIGEQSEAKVIIVARSSQWRVYEFLASERSRVFVNLLVIGQSEKIAAAEDEAAFIAYTHSLYVDGIGSSLPRVLTSWKGNNFARSVNMFPPKMKQGYAGHRFITSVAHQPPFVIKRGIDANSDIQWDGIEIRLIQMLSERFNFTIDLREAKDFATLGSGDSVTKDIALKRANLGIGGVYVTEERFVQADISQSHSYDCAAFITLMSTALPRYRAIMGPFHWSVWLALTFVYLFAIFPLVLSDKQTLKPLLKSPEEIENMFWYVFGTFTNCFTFKSSASWSKSDKITTRLLIAFYWLFTIITTACYTGSIIAFVTLPIFPETVDTTRQLVRGRYQIGTLDRGGWQYWFKNSTDPSTEKIFKSIEFLPNVQAGLKNVTKAFFWPYAFLGSRDELDFVVRTNFTTQSKRNLLHVSNNCFAPYGVSLLFPINSPYKRIIDKGVMRATESGFLIKIRNDVEWDIMRSPTGKLLQANAVGKMKWKIEDRPLSVDDTQGMFLLLGAGFLLGLFSLLSEWLGGCFNFCKAKVRRRLSSVTSSINSNPRSYDTPTPRDKVNSLDYSIHTRLCSIADETTLENDLRQNGLISRSPETNGCDDKHEERTNGVEVNEINYEEEIDKAFDLEDLFGEQFDTKAEKESTHELVVV